DRRIRKAAMQVPPGKTKEVDDENPCGRYPPNWRGASGNGRRSLAGRPTVGHPCSPWNGK
ncbi:MAG: hypothetical protein ACTSSA_08840, partial [Candidatus Freyarchaeota archaeon]